MIKYILLLFVFAFIIYISYWGNFFRNDFKLYFYFGQKGSGKSTMFTKLCAKYIKKGFTVYSDEINNIPGVRYFDPSRLGFELPPAKSVIFVGEGGILYDNRQFSKFKKEWLEFYKYQRHCKCIVYIGSQCWDIDKKIKDLVDASYYVRTRFNCLICARQINTKVEPVRTNGSDSATTIENTLSFAFPIPFLTIKYCWLPRWYKLHNSFELPERPELQYIPMEEMHK